MMLPNSAQEPVRCRWRAAQSHRHQVDKAAAVKQGSHISKARSDDDVLGLKIWVSDGSSMLISQVDEP